MASTSVFHVVVCLAAAWPAAASSTPETRCAADRRNCQADDQAWWGSGFLQESYMLSSRTKRMAVAESSFTQRSAQQSNFTPSTDVINVEDFGTRVVPFPWYIYTGIALIFAVIIVHEVKVACGMKPLMADEVTKGGNFLQIMGLWNTSAGFVAMSMTVPISLDFALSLGQGATSSGFFISAGVITGMFAIVTGKKLVDEVNWNQRYVRRLSVVCPMIALAIGFAGALFVQFTADSTNRTMIWWVMIILGQFGSFVGSLPIIPGMIFWSKITLEKNRTFWMVMTQCARNFGLVIGPLIFAILKAGVTGGGERLNPRSLMAWVQILLLILSIVSACFGAFVMPTEIPKLPTAGDSKEKEEEEMFEATGETKPEELPDQDREQIVWRMIYYSFERPFTISAVEVATIMMLEVFYGWDSYTTGIAFTLISSLGIVMSLVCIGLMKVGIVKESQVFFWSSVGGLIGCFFLFDSGLTGSMGAWGLLAADAMIYGGATVANGIAEGWASRAAKEGTSFSNGEYRTRNWLAVVFSRFLGPIVARFLVDMGGRNLYAGLQVIFVAMGTRTVYMTCRLIWDFNGPKTAAEKLLASAGEKGEKGEKTPVKNVEDAKVQEEKNDELDAPETMMDPDDDIVKDAAWRAALEEDANPPKQSATTA